MIEWLIFPIILLAGFVNAAAGFGIGLVAMPLLVATVGIEMAAPFFALTVTIANIILIYRYRADLDLWAVWRLCAAAFVGIPVGLFLAERVDERLVVAALGVVLVAYGVYALVGPALPRIKPHPWSYGIGFASGILTGAYNTGGPPVIVYASSQRWPLAAFKGNLQAYFFITGFVVNASHLAAGNFTRAVLVHVVLAVPLVFIAQWLGGRVDRVIDQRTFQRMVPALLVILGLTLIF